ncbi:BCCT family transporter [Pontibacterium granulatum]|uniref:BCCT family transporter n=1 Tax=Pontibacterium granulatum TaxID=2036029 RepID=UPI00249A4FB0|nr:BCCT family transporter [Pontibacterium granulatum]MDI3324770.1 BCCT family transporter [Pontibacterium granulatum]
MSNADKPAPLSTTTDYQIGQDNIQPFGLDIHNLVFPVSAVCIVVFVALTLVFQEQAGTFFNELRPWLTTQLDWFFVGSINFFILFCLYVAFSKTGRVRIGGPDAKPEFSYPGWLAMLFSAGIGIGLMFFGVLEPVTHMLNPPLGISPDAPEAARLGIAAATFHWGMSAWAVYAVVGLALAYFSFNHGLPLTLRSAFFPLLGDRVWGFTGHVIDILAVFATIFGLATSLGYGAEQIAAGLNELFEISPSNIVKVVLIIGITMIAIGSCVAGLDSGVKRLSEINMVMAVGLLLFVLFSGPTLELLSKFIIGLGDYLMYSFPLSNPVGREDTGFYHGWTTFYWAWWIAWSPFVGMFIARISKGRTVREFIVCVLIVPTLFCLLWMTVFGGAAIEQMAGGYDGVREAVNNWQPEVVLYRLLAELPMSFIVSFISLLLIVIFFVTSSDSGSLVIDTITAGGILNPPLPQRIFWCSFEGLVAIALLLGGGLGSLQAATVSTGFPFCIVLLLMCLSLYKGLRHERV